MKKLIFSMALAAIAPLAWGQVMESTTTTTTTTTGAGTITEYTPGSALVIKETSGPVTYKYGEKVTYVTKSGTVLSDDEVRTRIKIGVPVTVHYDTLEDARVVNRVVVDVD